MADETVGTGPDSAGAAGTGGDVTAGSDADQVRRKFREALDSKRGHGDVGGKKSADPSNQPHHASGPAKSQRSFRRKSG